MNFTFHRNLKNIRWIYSK